MVLLDQLFRSIVSCISLEPCVFHENQDSGYAILYLVLLVLCVVYRYLFA